MTMSKNNFSNENILANENTPKNVSLMIKKINMMNAPKRKVYESEIRWRRENREHIREYQNRRRREIRSGKRIPNLNSKAYQRQYYLQNRERSRLIEKEKRYVKKYMDKEDKLKEEIRFLKSILKKIRKEKGKV